MSASAGSSLARDAGVQPRRHCFGREEAVGRAIGTCRHRIFQVVANCIAGVIVLTAGLATEAQTTTGNSTTGSQLFGTYCSSCHLLSSSTLKNAANAGGHIRFAVLQDMARGFPAATLSDTQYADIAAYIGVVTGNPNPVNFPISYNSSGTAIAVPAIVLGTTFGKYFGLQPMGAPAKGTVSYSGTTATYTPYAGQSGNDSFSFQAYRASGGTSSLRSITVVIAQSGHGTACRSCPFTVNASLRSAA